MVSAEIPKSLREGVRAFNALLCPTHITTDVSAQHTQTPRLSFIPSKCRRSIGAGGTRRSDQRQRLARRAEGGRCGAVRKGSRRRGGGVGGKVFLSRLHHRQRCRSRFERSLSGVCRALIAVQRELALDGCQRLVVACAQLFAAAGQSRERSGGRRVVRLHQSVQMRLGLAHATRHFVQPTVRCASKGGQESGGSQSRTEEDKALTGVVRHRRILDVVLERVDAASHIVAEPFQLVEHTVHDL